jgi:hypothetical protein
MMLRRLVLWPMCLYYSAAMGAICISNKKYIYIDVCVFVCLCFAQPRSERKERRVDSRERAIYIIIESSFDFFCLLR